MTIIHRIELWILIKLLERRLESLFKELELIPNKGWSYHRVETIEEINEVQYMIAGLKNEEV